MNNPHCTIRVLPHLAEAWCQPNVVAQLKVSFPTHKLSITP